MGDVTNIHVQRLKIKQVRICRLGLKVKVWWFSMVRRDQS